MTVWGLNGTPKTLHLEPWRCYYLDIRKPHAVLNPSGADRVQLAIDVVVTPAVRDMIVAMSTQGDLI